MKWLVLGMLFCLFCGSVFSFPQLLPVQGKLKGQAAGDVNKVLPMTFKFYSVASGGSALWGVTKNVDVNIIDLDNNIGVFTTMVGDTAWLDVNSHGDWNYLGITIQSNSEMTPRIRLGAGAYSFISQRALSVDAAWFYSHDTNGGASSVPDTTCDNNAACRAWLFGLDWNASLKADINANFYGKLDVNAQFVPYVGAVRDVNLGVRGFKAFGDSNFGVLGILGKAFFRSDINVVGNVQAARFFGDGSGLTGVTGTADGFTATLDANANERAWLFGLDWNSQLERIADINAFFYRKTDINAGWYGITDVNRIFLSIRDANLWYYMKTDVNAHFQGKVDLNANYPGFVRLGNTTDLNLAQGGITAWDGNYYTLEANYFFGNGAGLTGVTSTTNWADINAHIYGKLDVNNTFVPYIGATRDINLNTKNLYIAGSLQNAGISLTIANLNTAYTHSQGNTQAHSDYLLNNADDTTTGKITAANFETAGLVEGGTIASLGQISLGGVFVTDQMFLNLGSITDETGIISFDDENLITTGKMSIGNDLNVGRDLNVARDINVNRGISAMAFFGNGSGLTGVLATTNWADINAHVYGKLDVNAAFVPYIAATKDVNLGIYGIKSFSSDSNFNAVYARQFFGSGANLTGIPSQADINAGFVGFVRIDNAKDLNLAAGGITAWDGNFYTVEADYFFGNGAGLTGVTATADVNGDDVNVNKLGIQGGLISISDANFLKGIKATAFFGNGSGLTGVTSTLADVNISHDANNIVVGYKAFGGQVGGAARNIAIGNFAGYNINHTVDNIFIGHWAGEQNQGNGKNVMIGSYAGYSNVTGMGNIFLGYYAGYNEIGINKLYIANSPTTTPLIGGDFDLNTVSMHADLNISQGINKGVSIQGDVSRICFPSNSCEMKIDFNGTAFVFGS